MNKARVQDHWAYESPGLVLIDDQKRFLGTHPYQRLCAGSNHWVDRNWLDIPPIDADGSDQDSRAHKKDEVRKKRAIEALVFGCLELSPSAVPILYREISKSIRNKVTPQMSTCKRQAAEECVFILGVALLASRFLLLSCEQTTIISLTVHHSHVARRHLLPIQRPFEPKLSGHKVPRFPRVVRCHIFSCASPGRTENRASVSPVPVP